MAGKILITGGAGYIGSHAVRACLEAGKEVVVFDNFSTGWREPMHILDKLGKLDVVEGDLRDFATINQVFADYEIEAVLHFAAMLLVDESMLEPELYWQNNVGGSANLLRAMKGASVKKIIFSSTSAVYDGFNTPLPIMETAVPHPLNPYGESKLMTEKMIKWVADLDPTFRFVMLRYFNVCGCASDALIGDSYQPPHLLMQNAVRGAMGIAPFYYTYTEVDTPDGSPIRDYIDVEDLIEAHMMALDYLDKEEMKNDVFNLGNGKGSSVKEIVAAVEKEFGKTLEKHEAEVRRQGENKAAYTSPAKAQEVLGWQAKKSIAESIASLRAWYEKYPEGYGV
ncbi:UDP-glucose 4-epimerase GalE [Microgenomates group bacterium]|nr:UDP-glucose 4-epimerase GalE [Microgenomates group bacterium]